MESTVCCDLRYVSNSARCNTTIQQRETRRHENPSLYEQHIRREPKCSSRSIWVPTSIPTSKRVLDKGAQEKVRMNPSLLSDMWNLSKLADERRMDRRVSKAHGRTSKTTPLIHCYSAMKGTIREGVNDKLLQSNLWSLRQVSWIKTGGSRSWSQSQPHHTTRSSILTTPKAIIPSKTTGRCRNKKVRSSYKKDNGTCCKVFRSECKRIL